MSDVYVLDIPGAGFSYFEPENWNPVDEDTNISLMYNCETFRITYHDNVPYTITLNANGGTLDGASTYNMRTEENWTTFANAQKDGMKFSHWDLNGTKLSVDTKKECPLTSDTTLLAKYTISQLEYTCGVAEYTTFYKGVITGLEKGQTISCSVWGIYDWKGRGFGNFECWLTPVKGNRSKAVVDINVPRSVRNNTTVTSKTFVLNTEDPLYVYMRTGNYSHIGGPTGHFRISILGEDTPYVPSGYTVSSDWICNMNYNRYLGDKTYVTYKSDLERGIYEYQSEEYVKNEICSFVSIIPTLEGWTAYVAENSTIGSEKREYYVDIADENHECISISLTGSSELSDSPTYGNITEIFRPRTYAITYELNGHGTAPSKTSYSYGETYAPSALTADGCTFNGWTPESAQKPDHSPIEFVAEWTPNTYDITYNLNGHGEEPAKKTYTYGESYTPPDLTADGYRFNGWTPECITPTTHGDVNFIASWTFTKRFTVTFDTDGGGEVESMSVISGEAIGELPQTYKEDYTFIGWVDDKQLNVTPAYVVTADITIHAKYI